MRNFLEYLWVGFVFFVGFYLLGYLIFLLTKLFS